MDASQRATSYPGPEAGDATASPVIKPSVRAIAPKRLDAPDHRPLLDNLHTNEELNLIDHCISRRLYISLFCSPLRSEWL